jgi:hypothetical protein
MALNLGPGRHCSRGGIVSYPTLAWWVICVLLISFWHLIGIEGLANKKGRQGSNHHQRPYSANHGLHGNLAQLTQESIPPQQHSYPGPGPAVKNLGSQPFSQIDGAALWALSNRPIGPILPGPRRSPWHPANPWPSHRRKPWQQNLKSIGR